MKTLNSLRIHSAWSESSLSVWKYIWHCITKTCLYNSEPPLTPLLFSKTGVYRGIHYFFLFLLKNIDCWYSLEPPLWGGSNEYPQSMFWAEIWKISEFLSENFQFLVVKFSIYLNRRVFVMLWSEWVDAQADLSVFWMHIQSCRNAVSSSFLKHNSLNT